MSSENGLGSGFGCHVCSLESGKCSNVCDSQERKWLATQGRPSGPVTVVHSDPGGSADYENKR